jgi:hypothetical protein
MPPIAAHIFSGPHRKDERDGAAPTPLNDLLRHRQRQLGVTSGNALIDHKISACPSEADIFFGDHDLDDADQVIGCPITT